MLNKSHYSQMCIQTIRYETNFWCKTHKLVNCVNEIWFIADELREFVTEKVQYENLGVPPWQSLAQRVSFPRRSGQHVNSHFYLLPRFSRISGFSRIPGFSIWPVHFAKLRYRGYLDFNRSHENAFFSKNAFSWLRWNKSSDEHSE